MKAENKRSVIVGIFVFLGIAILVTGILTLGGQQKKFVSAIELTTVFDNIDGLQTGNNIWFSGVKIGTVRKIDFTTGSKVRVLMNVEEKVVELIRKNSKATLSSDGLIGNKIIVIYDGTSDYPPVESGDELEGVMPLNTGAMLETLQVNNENLVDITADLKILTERLANGEGLVGALMTDSLLTESFKSILNNLDVAATNSNRLIADLTEFSGKLNQEGYLFNDLVTDTTMVPDIQATLNSLRAAAANSEQMTKDLESILSKFESGDNAIGVLLNDPEFAQDLKRIMINTDSATYNLNKGLEAIPYTWPFRKGFKRMEKEAAKEN